MNNSLKLSELNMQSSACSGGSDHDCQDCSAIESESLAKPWRATEEELKWWQDARFGLFIHWGPVSISGGDIGWCRDARRPFDILGEGSPSETGWKQLIVPKDVYDNLYRQFNPVDFNADEWVRIAKEAGMSYLVFTAKHHDSFSNFHTMMSDYSILNTPFKRDIVKELADACHKGGLKFGIYYSQRDWYHPDYLQGDNSKYNNFMCEQLRELLTNYGRVDILWFDSFGQSDLEKDWDVERIFTMARSLQPGILINNRLAILDQYNKGDKKFWGDFDTPEQKIGNYQIDRPWESCITLVGGQWSWMPDGEMFTYKECINKLVLSACGGGNLLLNVGPMPSGEIEPRQVQRLKEIGQWLSKNGKSIYATSGGPVQPAEWGGTTCRDNIVYVHVLSCPEDKIIRLGSLPDVVHSSVITGGKAAIVQDMGAVNISIESYEDDSVDMVIELVFDNDVRF